MISNIAEYLKGVFDAVILASTSTDNINIIKTVYNWKPRSFSDANIPAIVIEAIDSSYEKLNKYYRWVYRLKISVYISQKSTYADDQKTINDIVLIKQKVQELMEWKSTSACWFDQKSIAWILANKMCVVVDWCTLANDVYIESVNYEEVDNMWPIAYIWELTVRFLNWQIPYFIS